MAIEPGQAHSGLAYGGVVVSVVIVAAFGWTTYSVLTSHLSASDGQFGSILVGTLAAMATQVANYWLGSSVGSSAKNALAGECPEQPGGQRARTPRRTPALTLPRLGSLVPAPPGSRSPRSIVSIGLQNRALLDWAAPHFLV